MFVGVREKWSRRTRRIVVEIGGESRARFAMNLRFWRGGVINFLPDR
jgi:hypothetical protein